MSKRITKEIVETTTAGNRDKFIWDAGDKSLKGFGLKVTPRGRKVFIYQFRIGGRAGRTKRFTIGVYDSKTLTVTIARRRAEDLAAEVQAARSGDEKDPVQKRKDRREAEQRAKEAAAKGRLYKDAAEAFLQSLQVKSRSPKYIEEARRLLATETYDLWSDRDVATITNDEISDLLRDICDRPAPWVAKNLHAALRPLFKRTAKKHKLGGNPAEDIELDLPDITRDSLTTAELKKIWLAANEMPYPFGPIIQLLILTGQRRSEVSGMRGTEVDLDESVWIIPASRAKNDITHTVHLSTQAKKVIKPLLNGDGLVFTSSGDKPTSGFSKAKRNNDELSGVTGWRFHDLRRTMVEHMVEHLKPRISPDVADRILNHATGAKTPIQQIYNRAQLLPQRQKALIAWGRFISRLEK